MSKRIRVWEFNAQILPRSTFVIISEGERGNEEELLVLENIDEVDDLIYKLIAVRNRAWPLTPLEVHP